MARAAGDGVVEVEGVGQVEGGGDLDGAVEPDVAGVDVDVAVLGRGQPAGLGVSGSNLTRASSTSRSIAANPTLPTTGARWASTNAAASAEREMVWSVTTFAFHTRHRPASTAA